MSRQRGYGKKPSWPGIQIYSCGLLSGNPQRKRYYVRTFETNKAGFRTQNKKSLASFCSFYCKWISSICSNFVTFSAASMAGQTIWKHSVLIISAASPDIVCCKRQISNSSPFLYSFSWKSPIAAPISMFTFTTFTVSSPKIPSNFPSVWFWMISRTFASSSPDASTIRGIWISADSGEICGSSPEPDAVSRSAGISSCFASGFIPGSWQYPLLHVQQELG